jgi:hypothetical protein
MLDPTIASPPRRSLLRDVYAHEVHRAIQHVVEWGCRTPFWAVGRAGERQPRPAAIYCLCA